MAENVLSKLGSSLKGLALRHERVVKPGTPPGHLQPPRRRAPARITVHAYDAEGVDTEVDTDVGTAIRMAADQRVTWINVDGTGDPDVLSALGEHFDLHPLLIEDIANSNQRPKAETYPGTVFIVTRMARRTQDGPLMEQVSLVLLENVLLTFQERSGDVFQPVRDRIVQGQGRIRSEGPDYLAYRLLDAVVDGYFPVLDDVADRIEHLEEEAIDAHSPETLQGLQGVRRSILGLRHSITPMRDAVGILMRDEGDLVQKSTRVYLRDVHDHILQLIEMLANYHELSTSTMETYLSSMSHRMNEVMKVLTIMATIFIPLTFVAGIYGMNFDPDTSPWNMPELRWAYGYPAALLTMLVMGVAMAIVFKRKGWM